MKYFDFNVGPSTRKALVTTAVGGAYFENWQTRSFPSWKRYALAHDIGIIVLQERLGVGEDLVSKNASWDKLLAPELVETLFPQLATLCLLDTDVVIGPFAPDVFLQHKEGFYGVVSQERGLPFPIAQVRRRIAALRKRYYDSEFPIDSVLQASPKRIFEEHGLRSHSDYFCAGVIMLDRSQFSDLASCYRSVSPDATSRSVAWEEPFVNDWVQSRAHHWLPYEFQSIWLFEMAWSYPFLYEHRETVIDARGAREALAATLLNRHFVHFAGSWFESRVWSVMEDSAIFWDEEFERLLGEVQVAELSGRPVGRFVPED